MCNASNKCRWACHQTLIKYIPPNNTHIELLSSKFIYITKEETLEGYNEFLGALSIKTMNVDEFYNNNFFNKLKTFNDNIRNETMISILKIIKRDALSQSASSYSLSPSSKLMEIVKAKSCSSREVLR